MIEHGATIDGYSVERMLGRGGMGVVYEAVQTSLDRSVALKLLRPELAEDPAFVDRFRREGQLQASLEHPHVLDVYEVGESSEGLYLTMRLVRGSNLAELLRRGSLDGARTLRLLEQVAEALDAAHAIGLVHRDVKPRNVLVEDDAAFLGDFGLSRPGSDTMTTSRPTVGTVAYAAPEVVRGEVPGPASDRYAFAATLFHCLAGDVVFPRGSDAAVLYAHASEPPPRISERRPELPRALDPVFEAPLAKDPAERPATAREIVQSVRATLGEESLSSLDAPDLTPQTAPGQPAPPHSEPKSRLPRLGVLVGVAVAAAALGAGAVALLGQPNESRGDDVPVPALATGAQPLGSDLGLPARSLGCNGRAPASDTVACSIVQADLGDAQLLVPADGTIVGWSVRGARGEVALDVIRPGGDDTIRVQKSQWESAGNAAPHRFRTQLPVERGDRIGLELGRGAAIGVRETAGAATQRWLDPLGGFYGSPDRDAGTGFDYEVLVRAEFVPGAVPPKPTLITGAAAARARDGRVRDKNEVRISKPRATVLAQVTEVGDRVALDAVSDGRRVARMFIPGLRAGAEVFNVKSFTIEGEPFSEVGVWWVNPNSGRSIFHFFTVFKGRIEFLG